LCKGYSAPDVTAPTTISYSFGLSTDPLSGPFTTSITLTSGIANITLNQITAGPKSSVVISFGDGSATQTIAQIMVGTPVNISHAYTAPGTYVISGTATPTGLTGVNTNVTSMTVTVPVAPVYNGMSFNLFICRFISLFTC
jgi:PKD repeat protein